MTAEIDRICREHQRLTGDAEPTLESLWNVIKLDWRFQLAARGGAPTDSCAAERFLETETLEWLCLEHRACWTCYGTRLLHGGDCPDCENGYDAPHEPAEAPEDSEQDRLAHERDHAAGKL